MKIAQVFLFLSLFCIQLSVLAQDDNTELTAEDISTSLYRIEADIKGEQFLLENLDDYLEKLPTYTTWAGKCVTTTADSLKNNNSDLKKLGDKVEDEPSDVTFTRKKLSDKNSNLVVAQASCKAILVRSETAIKNIGLFRKKNLERTSFHQGDNIYVVIQKILSVSDFSSTRLAKLLESPSEIKVLNTSQMVMLLTILVIVIAIGFYIRSSISRWGNKRLVNWQNQQPGETDTGRSFIASLLMTVRRYVLPVIITTSLAIFMAIETFHLSPTPLITILIYDLPLLILTFALIYFVFIALPDLGLRKGIDKKILSSLRFRLAILATVVYLGHILFQTILANSLAEETFFLVRAILVLVLVLNIIWVLWLMRGIKGFWLSSRARILTSLLLAGALIAELTGYRNLSGFIVKGVVGTLVAFALFQVLSYILKRFLNEINRGEARWQQRLRLSIGVKESETIPGYFWIKFISQSAIWLLFIASLLFVWNVPEADIRQLTSSILQGFSIGSFKIVPIKIIEAIIALVVLLALNSWFQKQLEKKFLTMVGIERGARESIATISNYIGIALVFIIALAMIGMDFSKLAIIAGALSVGIGFGLQNVVNNFVSGLILLFERPIKTGDWIVASGVEGTVKKISIRSTQVESFDGADIIIPNSELISGNLTNWELKQKHGRVRVPIGVAYGSDTSLVKELLLKAAADHNDAISNDYSISDPQVVFLSFGDSSLNFELRFFIKDIKKRVHVLSDLNFAIDAAFRENGIEIPFPQRDVHIREESTGPKLTQDDEQEGTDKKDTSAD